MPRWKRGRVSDWATRHPFSILAVGTAVLGFIAWWEAARIEGARATVAHGWGAGLAAGILVSIGLTAIWWVMLLVTRGEPGRRQAAVLVLGLIVIASLVVCGRATLPPASTTAGPYVITTGIEVAGITYVATFSAYFAGLSIWAGIGLFRQGRRAQGSRRRPGPGPA